MPVISRRRGTGLNLDSHVNKKVVRDISDFLNKDYREYAHYVIQTRALPSLIDGFKIGARKILHAAFHGSMKNGAEVKNLNLVGDVYNLTLYMHGDASLHGTIFTEAAEFSNNLNPLIISGQHGSLRDPKAVSAPRYLHCKLSPFAKLYKVDEDLLEYVFDEGSYLEPVNYLPIIPTVLCARAEGMAPGYKFSCFSYNPLDIIDACIQYLQKEKITVNIRPFVRGINPDKFMFDKESGKWINFGTYTVDERNDVLQITDLPYDCTFEKFEKKLNSYIESEYIREWKNFSHDDVLDYRIQFPKSKLGREMQADRKEKTLKKFFLSSVVPDDILYVLNESQKVKKFDNKVELIEYFVEFRLSKYQDRKDKIIKVKQQKVEDISNLCKFIELVIDGKIVVSNRKTADVKKDLDKYKLPHDVLSVAISKLTKEEHDELLKKVEELKNEIIYIENTTIKEMYINDLKELRKDIKKEFDV